MFTDYNKFIKRLENIIPNVDTCDNDCRPKYFEQENNSLLRLKAKCNEAKITYDRVHDASDKIDCIINGYNIQHKTSSRKSKDSFPFGIRRSNGKNNGKRSFIPYSDKDGIDFFVFEIIDFKNNFYIVPIKILIEKGYIQTELMKGKEKIYIPSPTGKTNSHWIHEYLNNFDLLK